MDHQTTRTIERLEFLRELMSDLTAGAAEAKRTYQRTAFDRGFAQGLHAGYEQATRQIEIELEAFKQIATGKEPDSFMDWPLSKFHEMEEK